MDRNSTERNLQFALHAYKLGYAPVLLELEARRRWEMAELAEEPLLDREGYDPEPVWPEEDSPFPIELARYLREIQDAGDALVDSLPRSSRGRLSEGLSEAPERAWRAYEAARLGPRHRAKICEREAAEGGVDMLKASPFLLPAWRDFRRAVQGFADSLAEPLRLWAGLGSHLAAVEGIMPPMFRQDPLPDQVSPCPYPVAADLLQKLGAREPVLEGLELQDSDAWIVRQQQAKGLHEQILSRLAGSGEVAGGALERWFTASQALAIATGMGLTRSLSWLGKAAERQPPPFKSRRRGKRRRDVDLVSFCAFLLEEHKRASDEAVDPGRGRRKVLARPAIREEIEKGKKKENDKREKDEEQAKQAREQTRKERGDR